MSNSRITFFDSITLIEEVRKRPILYDMTLKQYHDRILKQKVWEEIAQIILPHWHNLTTTEKQHHARVIQQRWRSLRDSFVKDYKRGGVSRRGRRYLYHKEMMFIVPPMEKRNIMKRNGEMQLKTEDIDLEITPTIKDDGLTSDNSQISDDIEHSISQENLANDIRREIDVYYNNPVIRNRLISVQRQIEADKNFIFRPFELNFGEEPENLSARKPEVAVDDEDEDRLFLMSLLPAFKRMDQDAKFAVRIDILHAFRRAFAQM